MFHPWASQPTLATSHLPGAWPNPTVTPHPAISTWHRTRQASGPLPLQEPGPLASSPPVGPLCLTTSSDHLRAEGDALETSLPFGRGPGPTSPLVCDFC